MKKNLFITLLVLIAIFSVVFWMSREKDVAVTSPESASVTQVKDDKEEAELVDELDPEIEELREKFSEKEIENLKYNHQAAVAANQSVVFYGKCVNQDGEPIGGVSVKAKLTKMRKTMTSALANDGFKYYEYLETKSDENGRFEFIDKGSYLLLESIKKDGYMDARGPGRGFQFGQVLYGSAMAGMHEPDPLDPVVFTMWEKGDGSEALLTKRPEGGAGGPDVNIGKSAAGRPFYFDFSRGERSNNLAADSLRIIGKNEGDAHWDPVKLKNVVNNRYYPWSFQLDLPGGGLLETDDLFLFRPPESGYQESYEFAVTDAPEDWAGDVFGKKFYFKTGNGNYGSFILDVRSSAQGDVRFYFDKVFFNPNGERDLEYVQ